ncbi:MAG: ABC transporter ATP-binding protein [Planctomycetaceae bacterium]|nr:ABC transporter ATP-binding protein [Planctomycetaceae bacterium]
MSLIDLQNVTHYYGTHCALQGVTVSLAPGAIGLIGQNGAGKSTLLKILLGLVRPSQGTGAVLGRDIRGSGSELRGRVGYMPEAESFVPGLRGVDLVSLAGELSGMPRKQALRRAHEVLSYLGLEEARYRRSEEYSVGMKQRLKLATAMVHDPDLLLLDEPTAGLDPDGRDSMLALLASLATRHGKSLMLSTHLLGDIDRVCSQVVIVDRGQVRGVGRISELRSEYRGRYRLRWSGVAASFLDSLRSVGVNVDVNGRPDEALAEVPDGWPARRFFELANGSALTLREVHPLEEDLEAVYHRLIQA